MENQRIIKLNVAVVITGVLFAAPLFVSAYSEKTTHPALTQETVKFFNKSFPTFSLTDKEKERVIQGSIEDKEIQNQLKGKFDVILSDIAPKTTGVKERDQVISYILSRESFLIAKKLLNINGNFLVKTFQSQETEDLVKEMQPFFIFIKRYVPESTRQGSKEIYIVATGYKK